MLQTSLYSPAVSGLDANARAVTTTSAPGPQNTTTRSYYEEHYCSGMKFLQTWIASNKTWYPPQDIAMKHNTATDMTVDESDEENESTYTPSESPDSRSSAPPESSMSGSCSEKSDDYVMIEEIDLTSDTRTRARDSEVSNLRTGPATLKRT